MRLTPMTSGAAAATTTRVVRTGSWLAVSLIVGVSTLFFAGACSSSASDSTAASIGGETSTSFDGGAAPDVTSDTSTITNVGTCDVTFCAHFDSVSYIEGWDSEESEHGAPDITLAHGAEDASAGAGFLRASVRQAAVFDNRFLKKTLNIIGQPKKVTVKLAIRTVQTNTAATGASEVFAFGWGASSADVDAQLKPTRWAIIRVEGTYVAARYSQSVNGTLYPEWQSSSKVLTPVDGWRDIAFEIAFNGGAAPVITFSYKDEFWASHALAPPTLQESVVELQAGITDAKGGFNPTVIDLDEVRFNVEP